MPNIIELPLAPSRFLPARSRYSQPYSLVAAALRPLATRLLCEMAVQSGNLQWEEQRQQQKRHGRSWSHATRRKRWNKD